jgi:hypothetical protein
METQLVDTTLTDEQLLGQITDWPAGEYPIPDDPSVT